MIINDADCVQVVCSVNVLFSNDRLFLYGECLG